MDKADVLKVLERHYGRTNPITGKEIAEALDVRGTREIRQKILELTNDGIPIASSASKPPGYFICGSVAEMEEYSNFLKSYMKDIAVHRWRFIKASYLYRTGQLQERLL